MDCRLFVQSPLFTSMRRDRPPYAYRAFVLVRSGLEPYKSGPDRGRHACREVMLIRSMLIERVDCSFVCKGG